MFVLNLYCYMGQFNSCWIKSHTCFTAFGKMLSKSRSPFWIMCTVLICVQLFQILLRSHVSKFTYGYEHFNQKEHVYNHDQAMKGERNNVVNKIWEQKVPDTSKESQTADEVQSNIAEAKRLRDAERAGIVKFREFSKYDGRDLLKDPVFKFNTNFKNPCWFENEKLHCLPYVYVIGVKKCGTSDLFFRLSLHPDFITSGFKEAQWFARKRFKSGGADDNIYKYISMFSPAAEKIMEYSNISSSGQIYNYKHITGEGSPSNLHLNTHWKHLPGNENLNEPKYVHLDYIHHFIPQAKLLITFRDPIERLYSDYYHEYGTLMKTNRPNPHQFHIVVSKGVKLYQDCFKRHSVRACVYEPTLYAQTKIQIQLGIYYIFWQDLTRIFRREQILVLQNKNIRDKENTMKTVYKFLNLRNLNKKEMESVVNRKEVNTRKESFKQEGPMLNKTLEILKDFYRPFNRKMTEMTGDNDFLYGYAASPY